MVEWENDNYDAFPATAAEKQILIVLIVLKDLKEEEVAN